MRLNLGCGRDVREGYVNVDSLRLSGVDVVTDLFKMPWPWDDCSVDDSSVFDPRLQ